MMTDENTPDSKAFHPDDAPGSDSKKGQMLVIYLPEGSVIVDRTDMGIHPAYEPITERVTPTTVATPAPEITPPAISASVPQPLQVTLEEIVHLVVQEMMHNNEKGASSIQPIEKVKTPSTEQPSRKPEFADELDSINRPRPAARLIATPAQAPHVRRMHFRKRRQLNWVHGVNTFFVTFIVLVSVVPAILSSFYGVAIYASRAPHPGASIAQGDLMVSHVMPASGLKANDVVLVRDGNTWQLDVRQVTSNTTGSGISTLTTESTGGLAIDKTYAMPADTKVYQVLTIVPKLGYVPMYVASTVIKVFGGLFILILNLTIHYRRSRQRRMGASARRL